MVINDDHAFAATGKWCKSGLLEPLQPHNLEVLEIDNVVDVTQGIHIAPAHWKLNLMEGLALGV